MLWTQLEQAQARIVILETQLREETVATNAAVE